MSANESAVGSIKLGCYYIKLIPEKPVDNVDFYHGTLRLVRQEIVDPGLKKALESSHLADVLKQLNGSTTATESKLADGVIETLRASADVYVHPRKPDDVAAAAALYSIEKSLEGGEIDPRVPCFPRKDYYGYMEETAVYRGAVGEIIQTEPALEIRTLQSEPPSTTTKAGQETLSARFRFHRFDHATHRFGNLGRLTVTVKQDAERPDRFQGNVINEEGGQIVARIEMHWVTKYVRSALIQIDAVNVKQVPDAIWNGSKVLHDWTTVFKEAQWDVRTEPRFFSYAEPAASSSRSLRKVDKITTEQPDREWTDPELHAAMRFLRAENSFDTEWRYHLLCVGEFANPRYERGVMYDVAGVDTDEAPRGGAAIATRWRIPKRAKPSAKASQSASPTAPEDPRIDDWAGVEATLFGEAPALYFRTAVHEVGHEMGLGHASGGASFMNTTDDIARQATAKVNDLKKDFLREALELTFNPGEAGKAKRHTGKSPDPIAAKRAERDAAIAKERFPNNVEFKFSKEDLRRLCHGPDVMVRPGAFNDQDLPAFADDAPAPADGLELQVSPFLAAVPYGAPVRIHLRLTNISNDKQYGVPESLNLKSGFVSGEVIDPRGKSVPFEALLRSEDESRERPGGLERGESQCHTMTLLRGNTGALFPREGTHRVRVQVEWSRAGRIVSAHGETSVEVTPPADSPQRVAAVRILNTPRALFALAMGDPQDPATEAALRECFEDRFLGPHYRIIEIKRRILAIPKTSAGDRFAELPGMIDEAVLSVSELLTVSTMLVEQAQYAQGSADFKAAAKLFRDKLAALFRREANEFYT